MMEVFCNFCGTKMNSVSIGWLCLKCKAFRDMNGNVHEHENKPFLPPQTNADYIRSMTDEELADWIDSMLNQDRDDWNVPGCYSCINFGTHHSDPENKGTHLYECSECDHEGSYEYGLKYGVLNWLRKPKETLVSKEQILKNEVGTCKDCKYLYIKDFVTGCCEREFSGKNVVQPDDSCELWEEKL